MPYYTDVIMRDSVSNHQSRDCLLNRLFRRKSKKTSKLRVIGFCAGNSAATGEFPAQMASSAENVSIWCHLAGMLKYQSEDIYLVIICTRRTLNHKMWLINIAYSRVWICVCVQTNSLKMTDTILPYIRVLHVLIRWSQATHIYMYVSLVNTA